MLGPEENLLGRIAAHLQARLQLTVGHAAVAAEEIERRVGGDPRKPMRRLLIVLELVLTLQSLDESFLRQILGVGGIADNAVDLDEDAAKVVGDKAVLPLQTLGGGLDRFFQRVDHLTGLREHSGIHTLYEDDAGYRKTWKLVSPQSCGLIFQ